MIVWKCDHVRYGMSNNFGVFHMAIHNQAFGQFFVMNVSFSSFQYDLSCWDYMDVVNLTDFVYAKI